MNKFYEEYDRLLKIVKEEGIQSIIRKKTENVIEWQMTDWCNYRCPYCITEKTKDTKKQTTEELIEIAKKIKKFINKEEQYRMLLKGGEVTFFDLDKILSVFKDYKIKYVTTTNFSNKIEYYTNLVKKYNFSFDISYHIQTDEDKFIEKIKTLSNCIDKKNIMIGFVIGHQATDEKYNKVIKRIKKEFPDIKIKILPLKIKGAAEYVKPIFQISDHGQIVVNGKHNFNINILNIPSLLPEFDPYGYKCFSKYVLTVDVDGNFVTHKCQDIVEKIITCKVHNCNFCTVGGIFK